MATSDPREYVSDVDLADQATPAVPDDANEQIDAQIDPAKADIADQIDQATVVPDLDEEDLR